MANPSLLDGFVGVRVRINEFGDVCEAHLEPQSGRSRLDRGLLISAGQWRFNEPRHRGHPACVDSTFRFRYETAVHERATYDKPPKPTHTTPAVYPEAARKDQLGGTVFVMVTIDADGTVVGVQVAHSEGATPEEPAHPLLVQSALNAARSWIFEPAERHGRPVGCVTEIPFRFPLD